MLRLWQQGASYNQPRRITLKIMPNPLKYLNVSGNEIISLSFVVATMSCQNPKLSQILEHIKQPNHNLHFFKSHNISRYKIMQLFPYNSKFLKSQIPYFWPHEISPIHIYTTLIQSCRKTLTLKSPTSSATISNL